MQAPHRMLQLSLGQKIGCVCVYLILVLDRLISLVKMLGKMQADFKGCHNKKALKAYSDAKLYICESKIEIQEDE